MKSVSIVGAGMSPATVTQQGWQELQQADVLLGAPRLLDAYAGLQKPVYAGYAPDQVARLVGESACERFAVLVSGDTGFYSAADGLCRALADCRVQLVPGVSSLSYFFAKLEKPWQEAALLSCHGRKENLVDTVRRNRLTFALTGGNLRVLAEALAEAGFGALNTWVGENLGMTDERILSQNVAELVNTTAGSLSVLLVENSQNDARIHSGISDSAFRRGNVPMTKAEVRAVTLSKLALRPASICCDIGAGTGSVTVEMALAAYQGHVYALDKNEAALELVRANCRQFHIGNVSTILGDAPSALAQLPPCEAAFIGGSAGRISGIVAALLAKNPHTRIVANAVTLESLHAVTEALTCHGLMVEVVQISVNKTTAVGGLKLLTAQNPVFIISGGGNE